MLVNLSIKNYALIDELSIDFQSGLNIITGETGSGKSIIIDALGLVLGDRADTNVAKDKSQKSLVEATFDVSQLNLQGFFTENELDYETTTIVRREITSQGKSRAFINDTPVTLNIIKEFSTRVIDVHSQHQTMQLNDQSYQLNLVDALADTSKELTSYTQQYGVFKDAQKRLFELKKIETESAQELDYLTFLLSEFEGLELENIHQQEMEDELKTLENAEEIKEALTNTCAIIDQSEQGATHLLTNANALLSKISNYGKSYADLSERIKSSLIELRDIASELEQLNEYIEYNPTRLEQLTETLSKCYRLQKKHGLNSNEELLAFKAELEQKLGTIHSIESQIAKQEKLVKDSEELLLKLAQALSNKRCKSFTKIEKQIKDILQSVGMASAEISIQNEAKPFSADGIDSVLFLAKTNKGSQFKPIHQIASGGELSRIMLALKSILSKYKQLPTIIFDEIDTGISGEVADKVGKLMQELSKNLQVFSITHLPQVAAKGNAHYFVYKTETKNSTHTHIKLLSNEDRVVALAKMMSGEKLTDASILNAKELLKANH
jgi:DNA repair protein RecN (Recombination protein N)